MSKNFDDVFDYFKEEEVNRKERKKYALCLGAFAGGVLLGALGMYGLNHLNAPKIIPLAQLPVMYPEPTPLKEEPKEEGGMEVLNRDKTVYNVIKSKDAIELNSQEKVLPPPEEPLVVGSEKAGSQTEGVQSELLQSEASPSAHAGSAKGEETNAKKEIYDIANLNESGENESSIDELKKEVEAEKPKVHSVVLAVDRRPARVQLGAFKSEAEANKAWDKIRKQDLSLLGLFPTISATSNNKGVFYRLQAGPLAGDKAKALCHLLNSKHQECFLVK